MAVLDSLLVELGFDYDPKEMQAFRADVDKTTSAIKSLAKVAVGAATALTGIAVASTAASDEQGKLASEIGESVENIDAMQFALTRAGGTAEGMASSMRNLATKAAEAARGVGSGVEAFGLLGISATNADGSIKSTSELMLEVSKQFQGLDKARQIELADKLGLGDSLRLLQESPDAIRALTDEAKALGVTTSEDAAMAAEFQDSLTDLWRIIKQVSRTITSVFAPALNGIVDIFTDWWKSNRAIIEQNFPVWVDRMVKALKLLSLAAAAFIAVRLVSNVMSLISVFKGASLAAMAMNAAVLALPALIAAAITGFLLLVEDAKVFFEGGESFIGDMIEKFPQWQSEIVAVASVLNAVWEVTELIFEGWGMIFDLFENFSVDGFLEVLKNIPGFIEHIFNSVVESISGMIDGLIEKFKELPIVGQVTELISGAGDFFSSLNPFSSDDDSMTQAVAPIPTTTINSQTINTSGSQAANETKVGTININVDGSSSPEAVAQEVNRIFQQTTQDLGTAVDQ